MPRKELLGPRATPEVRCTLMLTLTQNCNLQCRYCYEPTKSARDMSLQTAQEAIIKCMESVDDEYDAVEIDFFGGEPMLAFDLIREIVDWFHTRPWPKGYTFFISTNGTILTEEMKAWLVERKCITVGLSMDGNKVAHDLSRDNSYDRVMKNLPFFMQHWGEQPVKMTFCAETIPYVADSIIEMEEMGILRFSANVVFEDIWGTPEQKSALLEVYAQQLDRLVGYYAAHPDLFPASIVDRAPEVLHFGEHTKQQGDDCVRFCGAGHGMAMVDVEGNWYPCHRFAPWITGRPAPEGVVNHQAAWKPEKCAECRLVAACPTCVGFNWQENGDTAVRTTYHCEAFKLEVLASAKLQALRFLQKQASDLTALPPEEALTTKERLDAILELAATGL
jgi:radical SAM protein with 4Fe4S-binding SPASM domain